MNDPTVKRNLFGLMVLAALLAVLPFILSSYQLRLMTEGIIFSLFAVSYNLLLGYAGMLSFGHAMFFGVGAFSAGVALNHIPGLPFLAAACLGASFTAGAGFAIGCLLLRVKGTPFALLTLAFNAIFHAVAIKWTSVTGGDDGLILAPPDIDLGFMIVNTARGFGLYYVTLIVIGTAVAFCYYFTRTAMGQSVLLMRENEERMRFIGYNTSIARLILFTMSGTLAGLAGSFYALFHAFVSHEAISLDMTTEVLLMTFIGGTGHFFGPVIGAFFFIHLQDFLSDLTENWPLFMGLLFIVMVLFTPGGLSDLLKRLIDRLTHRSDAVERRVEEE